MKQGVMVSVLQPKVRFDIPLNHSDAVNMYLLKNGYTKLPFLT